MARQKFNPIRGAMHLPADCSKPEEIDWQPPRDENVLRYTVNKMYYEGVPASAIGRALNLTKKAVRAFIMPAKFYVPKGR
jgi:hypothetical protein